MLNSLKIAGTEDLPEVIFDIERNVFRLNGRSLPEDSYEFYHPLISWMDEYVKNPNPVTVFQISLEYFNSSSLKQIFYLLSKLDIIIKNGKQAKIIWNYLKEDELMKLKCGEFENLLKVPFEMIEHQTKFNNIKI